jgi:putative ABC transport system permease protein
VTDALRDGAARASTPGRSQGHLRDLLVAAEVALSIVLLIAAGLLVRSFSRLYDVHSGVRIDNMITMRTSLSGANYREAVRRSEFWTEIRERVRRVAGIDSVGLVSCAPLTGACNILFYYVEGRPFVPGKFFAAFERSALPDHRRGWRCPARARRPDRADSLPAAARYRQRQRGHSHTYQLRS